MGKDWTGNYKSIYTTLGASSHSLTERQVDDYYATEPKAVELLLEQETFSNTVWECAVGGGHMAEVLVKNGYNVVASDVVDRGYPDTIVLDFLKDGYNMGCDIITNPPYKFAKEFVEQAIRLVGCGGKVAMFLKLQFLEGKARKELFKKYPPKVVYVSSSRLKCAMNGDFDSLGSSAVAYGWFVWEDGFTGDPIIRWIN